MAPIGNIHLPEVVETLFFSQNPSPGNPHPPTDPIAAEKGEAKEADTRADIDRILGRCPGPRGQVCRLGVLQERGEEADALRRAAREFYLGAMEEKRRRRRRPLAVCAVFAVVGFAAWWVWCAYR